MSDHTIVIVWVMKIFFDDTTLMAQSEDALKSLLMKVKSESEATQSCLTLATPWTAAYQALPSMGFSRQKYWSRVRVRWVQIFWREVWQNVVTSK